MRRPLPPSRTRRIAKWAGLVICVVIVGAWALSTNYWIWYNAATYPNFFLVSNRGVTGLGWGTLRGYPGWEMGRTESFALGFNLPDVSFDHLSTTVEVPFWLPLTVAAIPTALLWHRDRRTVRPGCCRQCGYDLRASRKTCPECGTAIA